MLSRVSKAAQSLAPIALRTGLTRLFSTSSPDVLENLSDFDPARTRKILRHVHHHKDSDPSINLKCLLTLDTIAETPYSTTHRAFDQYHKNFVAVRTFKLETPREWNQVNLALRQFHVVKPTLGKVLAMDYNEENEEVKIITELGKSTAGEYSYFRMKNEKPWTKWTNDELRLLYLNIVNQLNALREFGGVCEAIKPRNMYYDPKAQMLKLYDLSDFDAVKGYRGFNLDDKVPIHIDSAVYSLVQMINPYAPVHNSEEAQAYLRANHSDFLNEFESLQDQVKKWQFLHSGVVRILLEDLLKNPKTKWFSEHQYEQFLLNKMETVWETKGLSKSSEEWATLNQGLGNYIEAINTLQQQLAKTLKGRDENNPDTSKVYGNLAGVYQAADNFEKAHKYFEKAINAGESCSNMDKIVMAQIYNSYGKFLMGQKKYTEAIDFFTKAEKILVGAPADATYLSLEIGKNISHAQHSLKVNNTSSSYNSNEKSDRKSTFSRLFRILSYIVFIKVTCLLLKEIQKKLDQLPNYYPKELDLISPPNQTETTDLQKDQPPVKHEPLKPQPLKNEDKQLGSVSHENLSADKSESQEGTTIKQSLLFGAILVISALGLTL